MKRKMQLTKKKQLAARVLNVGKSRIIFVKENLNEIKEAITRQDIIDMHNSGAIRIREEKGRRKIEKRKHRRGKGKFRLKIKNEKQEYVKLTRKLRTFVKFLLKTGKVDKEKFLRIRKMIKAKKFRSKKHLLEVLKEI